MSDSHLLYIRSVRKREKKGEEEGNERTAVNANNVGRPLFLVDLSVLVLSHSHQPIGSVPIQCSSLLAVRQRSSSSLRSRRLRRKREAFFFSSPRRWSSGRCVKIDRDGRNDGARRRSDEKEKQKGLTDVDHGKEREIR